MGKGRSHTAKRIDARGHCDEDLSELTRIDLCWAKMSKSLYPCLHQSLETSWQEGGPGHGGWFSAAETMLPTGCLVTVLPSPGMTSPSLKGDLDNASH